MPIDKYLHQIGSHICFAETASYAPTNVLYPTVLQIIRNKCELQTFPHGVTSHCDTVLGLVLTSWSLGGAGLETGDWRRRKSRVKTMAGLVTVVHPQLSW